MVCLVFLRSLCIFGIFKSREVELNRWRRADNFKLLKSDTSPTDAEKLFDLQGDFLTTTSEKRAGSFSFEVPASFKTHKTTADLKDFLW